jgi:hypothetical protein
LRELSQQSSRDRYIFYFDNYIIRATPIPVPSQGMRVILNDQHI